MINDSLDRSSFESKSKSELEIVITRYLGDLTWSDPLSHLCTVYDKSPDESRLPDAIHVDNYGVSEEVILRHIIENYYSLADVTFFTQQSIGDRLDQKCLPLSEYLSCSRNQFVGSLFEMYFSPGWKIGYFMTGDVRFDRGSSAHTLYSFSKYVLGMAQDFSLRRWVPGSYFAVGKDLVHRKSLEYYRMIYGVCDFKRGNGVGNYNGSVNEEVYFLERLYWSIFNLEVDYQCH
jgi:hypothetical protein